MTREEYFKLALAKKLPNKLNWHIVMFSLYVEENDYCVMRDDVMYMKIEGSEIPLDDYNPDQPFIIHTDKLMLNPGDLANVTESVESTFGRALVNYLLLVHPFKTPIPYINTPKELNSGNLESIVMKKLSNDEIEVSEYLKFVDNAMFLSNLSRQVLTTVTEKNLLPNPEMKNIKANLAKEFNEKYGNDWHKDPLRIGEFTATLEKIDNDYLEGDKAKGITMTGKALAARRKLLLTYGSSPSGLDPNPKFMMESLADGYPLDGELMSGVINGIIDGSIARGKETQKGGVIYKQLTKMGRDMKVMPGDCGSKIYKKIKVTEDNHQALMGLNIKEGNAYREITDTKQYVGKEIEVRSPLFCKMGGKHYCEVCVGKNLKGKKEGIGMMFTYLSEVFLSASLKKMHNTGLKLTDYKLRDFIS